VTVLHPYDLHNFSVYSVTESNKYSQQELRFMKSQDASYLALKAQTEMKVRASYAIRQGKWFVLFYECQSRCAQNLAQEGLIRLLLCCCSC